MKHLNVLYLISISFCIILLLSNVSVIAEQVFIKTDNITYAKYSNDNSYILQFLDEPLFKFRNRILLNANNNLISKSNITQDLISLKKFENYKLKLFLTHLNAKIDILKFLNLKKSSNIFSKEFFGVFNGISIKNIPKNIIDKIKVLPYVKNIIPNEKISVCLDKSVSIINADKVWELKDPYNRNITGKDITIAFLDTGVDYNHPDLKDNFIFNGSYDFVNNDNDSMDDQGHGTHVAGIICGKGNSSNNKYIGIAPDAKFYMFKILDKDGNGNLESYLSGMQRALDPNNDNDISDHVDIISLSFGTEEPGSPNDSICEIANYAVDAGVVVVAAAGNNGGPLKTNQITSPGCAIKVICVGASDKFDKAADFSSRGPVQWNGNLIIKPDLVAPGVQINSCKIGGGYISYSGTSMAAPHVAGAAALILQANPGYSEEKVKQVLIDTAVDLFFDKNSQGNGRVDVLRAISNDDKIFINSPSEIYCGQSFHVKITNNTGSLVKAWILLNIPGHFPKLKYGSSVSFFAPYIFSKDKNSVIGEIIVFKKIVDTDRFKTQIIINKKP